MALAELLEWADVHQAEHERKDGRVATLLLYQHRRVKGAAAAMHELVVLTALLFGAVLLLAVAVAVK